ncbi:MAG: NAD(P)H-hydrate dehydratase [Tannerellaceae bacterium]|jgi:NAD(P)H-hydrate epimerase|nr:NAD(P)H-hydrate dehydratase [Tannerellaceae bacterium]
MIKIFTSGQIKELDRYTIENEPIREEDLVERAANAFACEFARRYGRQRRVAVFAGQGNNGADALAVARLLSEDHLFARVETFLFNPPAGSLSEAAAINRQRLMASAGSAFTEVSSHFSPPPLEAGDIVVDGLFGSGLNRPLTGGFAAVATYINRSPATVVSIDLPSGLFGEDNSHNTPDTIIRADLTLTFCFPRLAFLLPGADVFTGVWKTLDIGLHPEAIASTPTPYMFISEEDASAALRPRGKFAHKGDFGHALLVAGSRGKMGAALLAARACMRAGAGLLTAHVPACGEVIMQTACPEAMLSLDHDPGCVTSPPPPAGYTAAGVGPGLGRSSGSAAALKSLLTEAAGRPLVIDADALNLIAADAGLMQLIPHGAILTPHVREFDRLSGEAPPTPYHRLILAQDFARRHSLFIILKGAYTAICTPEGEVIFNSSGNPGMATAGSGDVLTGVILGLLASGHPPREAAILGVFIHGLAGDLSALRQSEESLTAGDITEDIGRAYRHTRSED